jgi:hypothetical protein
MSKRKPPTLFNEGRIKAQRTLDREPLPPADTPPTPRWATEDGDIDDRPDGPTVPICSLMCPWYESRERRNAASVLAGGLAFGRRDGCAKNDTDEADGAICWPVVAELHTSRESEET